MEEAVRFELTEPFGSSRFKRGAINQTLPHFLFFIFNLLVEQIGFEPIHPKELVYSQPQLSNFTAVTNFHNKAYYGKHSNHITPSLGQVLSTAACHPFGRGSMLYYGAGMGIRTPTAQLGRLATHLKFTRIC